MSMTLRTPRLILREWRDSDRGSLAEMSAAPIIMEYMLPMDRSASDNWIARMQANRDEHGFCQWAVEIPGEAAFIGAVGLKSVRAMIAAP